jgi:hypothetical protein
MMHSFANADMAREVNARPRKTFPKGRHFRHDGALHQRRVCKPSS